MAKLEPKTLDQLLSALEDHLFLLAQSLHGLSGGDAAYIRELAAKMRALVCSSAGVDGLLWRVCAAVGVDDMVEIRYPGKIDTSNPLTRGMLYAFVPVAPDGSGDARVPRCPWSLQDHIKLHEAVFVEGESITRESLIKALADTAGIAHEADGVSKIIAKLNAYLLGDVQPYIAVLDSDARLTLEVGERAVQSAVARGYRRRRVQSSAPSPRSLPSVRFSQSLDLPTTSGPSSDEGTALFAIHVKRADDAGRPFHFPPLESRGIVVHVQINRRNRLEVATEGLLFPFGFECAMPADDGKSVGIAITWKGADVRAYVAGEQVAGMRDKQSSTA